MPQTMIFWTISSEHARVQVTRNRENVKHACSLIQMCLDILIQAGIDPKPRHVDNARRVQHSPACEMV